jgi:electron-transferring-flavoprotein dehydrogenase
VPLLLLAPGSHILSGNVLETRALDDLLPKWRDDSDAPIRTPAKGHRFMLLTERHGWRLPNPPQMRTKGAYVVSLRREVLPRT